MAEVLQHAGWKLVHRIVDSEGKLMSSSSNGRIHIRRQRSSGRINVEFHDMYYVNYYLDETRAQLLSPFLIRPLPR